MLLHKIVAPISQCCFMGYFALLKISLVLVKSLDAFFKLTQVSFFKSRNNLVSVMNVNTPVCLTYVHPTIYNIMHGHDLPDLP